MNSKCIEIIQRRTLLVVGLQLLEHPVIALERVGPPPVGWTEQEKTFPKVEREVMVRDKLSIIQRADSQEIGLDMGVEYVRAVPRHGASGCKINGGGEVHKVFQSSLLIVGCGGTTPQTAQCDYHVHGAQGPPVVSFELARRCTADIGGGTLEP